MNEIRSEITDRKLGHEWYHWDGNAATHEGDLEEPKRLYLKLLLLTWGVAAAIAGGFLYLISPRLASWTPALATAATAAYGLALLAAFGWVALLVLELATGRNIIPSRRLVPFLARGVFYLKPAGKLFGISKDRIGSSFVAIANVVYRAQMSRNDAGRPLILVPRCIEVGNREQLKSLAQEYNCEVFVAPTGESARKKLITARPTALIAVACERDLITGLRDVGERLPILSVAIKRPEGPCKNAHIKLQDLRDALEFLGKQQGQKSPAPNPELEPAAKS